MLAELTVETDKFNHHTYGPAYDELFRFRRHTVRKVLEIGVFKGGSLRLWRDFFPDAEIVGLDASRKFQFKSPRISTVHGRQADAGTLAHLRELGPFDVVIDDGSHLLSDQVTSLWGLWPALAPGGVYVIEDLQDPDWWLARVPGHVVDLRGNGGPPDDALFTINKPGYR